MSASRALMTPARYTIRLEGPLEPRLAAWFADLSPVALPGGQVQLSGLLPDQPALHGVLESIRDLNLVLISVVRED